jgi:Methyltransferase domain
MPQCSECAMLVNNQCSIEQKAESILGRKVTPPPTGTCEIAIVDSYLPLIKPGMRILEIGCGAWKYIKNYCDKIGAEYHGIDTELEYFGKKSIATRFENLAELSYEDDYFDFVIGNQTMEHWGENGCTLQWGLYQCFRVCKPFGKVLLNVPIHYHGTETFLLGKLDEIKELFQPFSEQVNYDVWGNPSSPIPTYYPHPGYWKLKNNPAYVMDIHATKDKSLPTGYSNRGATNGWTAKLLNNPPSYIFYRILRQVGLMPKPEK